METISRLLVSAFREVSRTGPIRVLRWFIALFYPLLELFVAGAKRLWLVFVKDQNNEAKQREVEM